MIDCRLLQTNPGLSSEYILTMIYVLTFQSNFVYNSSYWSNEIPFNTSGGKTGFDDQETKMPTYWSTAFNNICLGMKLKGKTNWIKLNHSAESLHSVIADGVYKPTSVGRNTWKSLLDNSSLQTQCDLEGFNSNASAINVPNPAVVRIGIIADNNHNCLNCNSRIGVGGGGDRGGQEVNPCGNEASFSDPYIKQHLEAFCYILLQQNTHKKKIDSERKPSVRRTWYTMLIQLSCCLILP